MHKRSILFVLLICLVLPILRSDAAKAGKKADKPAPEPAAAEERLDPVLTVGVLTSEEYVEGVGDIMIPLYFTGQGLFFVNPRSSLTDDGAEEYNLGVGYRHLLKDGQALVGGNLFYDNRNTTRGARFDQVGAGVEYLSHFLDARANVYYPLQDKKLVQTVPVVEESTSSGSETAVRVLWADPEAAGNDIFQEYDVVRGTRSWTTTTKTTRYFKQYEVALQGWDAEVGIRLPLAVIEDYLRLKLFGGYYDYRGKHGVDDVVGFRGRAEFQLRPSIFLDAVYYSNDELTGGNYSLGLYAALPFDIANISKGKNPFAGAMEIWEAGKRRENALYRMTDMVKRDPQIRTDLTELEEKKEETSTTSTTTVKEEVKQLASGTETVATDITFVDQDNSGSPGQDGTYENPYESIQAGVNDPRSMVFVFDADDIYWESVLLTDNVILRGAGCPLRANGGKVFGDGVYPVVDAGGIGPTITMAENTVVQGFEIRNTVAGLAAGDGIFSTVGNVSILCNYIHDAIHGVYVNRTGANAGDVNVLLGNNSFADNISAGAVIDGVGASGTYFVYAHDNSFWNNGMGLHLIADNYDMAMAVLDGNYAFENAFGIRVNMTARDMTLLSLTDTRADNNAAMGVDANIVSTDGAAIVLGGMPSVLMDLINDAIGGGPLPPEFEALLSGSGPIWAGDNDVMGLNINVMGSYLAALALLDVRANNNGVFGTIANVTSPNGTALGLVGSSENLMEVAQLGAEVLELLLPGLELPSILSSPVGPAQFNNNDIGGLFLNVSGFNFALGSVLGVEASDNQATMGVEMRVGSPNGPAIGAMARITANDNAVMGILSDIQAPNSLALGALFDIHAMGNGVDGINSTVAGSSAISLLGSTDFIRSLAGLVDPPLAIPGSAYGPLVASGNDANGIYAVAQGESLAVLAMLDIRANDNGVFGTIANVASPNGAAIGMVASTENLMEVGQLLVNVLGLLSPGMGLPELPIPAMGPVEFNDNDIGGLLMNVEGDYLALGLGLGIDANDNGPAGGVDFRVGSPNGTAISLLGRVNANGNTGNGILNNVTADGVALAALLDIHASYNDLNGLYMNVSGDQAIGLVAATDPLRSLADVLNDQLALDPPLVIPGQPFGPVVASDNGLNGIQANIVGEYFAAGAFLDVQANNNHLFGIAANIQSPEGDAFGVFGSTDVLFELVPPILGSIINDDPASIPVPAYVPMGDMSVSGNEGGGIWAEIHGRYGANLVAGGINASDNLDIAGPPGNGLAFNMSSADGVVFAGLYGLTADNNAGAGIVLNALGELDAIIALLNSQANGNAGQGIQMNVNSSAEDAVLILAGVDAIGNGIQGMTIGVNAARDLGVAITAVNASDNLRQGLLLNATAGDDGYVWIGDLAIDDLRNEFGTFDILGSSNALYSIMQTGPSVFNNNGFDVDDPGARAGVRLNLTAQEEAYAAVIGSTANGNSGNGFHIVMQSINGDASLLLEDNVASGNGVHGFRTTLTASDAASVSFIGNTADDNDNVGAFVELGGDVQNLYGVGNRFRYNNVGLRVAMAPGASTYALDFGGGAFVSPGLNSIFGNINRDVRNNEGAAPLLMAENNWWGTVTPAGAQFAGSVDYTPWLLVDPNP